MKLWRALCLSKKGSGVFPGLLLCVRGGVFPQRESCARDVQLFANTGSGGGVEDYLFSLLLLYPDGGSS